MMNMKNPLLMWDWTLAQFKSQ